MGCTVVPYTYQDKHEFKIRHYDNRGRYEGYSICNDYGCRHYDKNSRYKGYTK
ncbi:MAG: hypothetical protein ACFFG0_01760 [Candidatus Thorarchaeota archaeon]